MILNIAHNSIMGRQYLMHEDTLLGDPFTPGFYDLVDSQSTISQSSLRNLARAGDLAGNKQIIFADNHECTILVRLVPVIRG